MTSREKVAIIAKSSGVGAVANFVGRRILSAASDSCATRSRSVLDRDVPDNWRDLLYRAKLEQIRLSVGLEDQKDIFVAVEEVLGKAEEAWKSRKRVGSA